MTKKNDLSKELEAYRFVSSKERFCQKCESHTMHDIYVSKFISIKIVFYICNVCSRISKKSGWGND